MVMLVQRRRTGVLQVEALRCGRSAMQRPKAGRGKGGPQGGERISVPARSIGRGVLSAGSFGTASKRRLAHHPEDVADAGRKRKKIRVEAPDATPTTAGDSWPLSAYVFDRGPGGVKRTAQSTQQAVKERLQSVLGPKTSALVVWGKTSYPTIANRDALKSHRAFKTLSGKVSAAIFRDYSARTPLESAGGVGMVGISRVDGRSGFSLEDLSRIAEDVYEPSVLAVGTRDGYESSFRKAFFYFCLSTRWRIYYRQAFMISKHRDVASW